MLLPPPSALMYDQLIFQTKRGRYQCLSRCPLLQRNGNGVHSLPTRWDSFEESSCLFWYRQYQTVCVVSFVTEPLEANPPLPLLTTPGTTINDITRTHLNCEICRSLLEPNCNCSSTDQFCYFNGFRELTNMEHRNVRSWYFRESLTLLILRYNQLPFILEEIS